MPRKPPSDTALHTAEAYCRQRLIEQALRALCDDAGDDDWSGALLTLLIELREHRRRPK